MPFVVVSFTLFLSLLTTFVLSNPISPPLLNPNLNLPSLVAKLSPLILSKLKPSLLPSLRLSLSSLDLDEPDAPQYFNVTSLPFYDDTDEDTGAVVTLPALPLAPLADASLFKSKNFIEDMSKVWDYSLPAILAEYNTTGNIDNLTAEAVPIFGEILEGIFEDEAQPGEEEPDDGILKRSSSLSRRRLRDKIKKKLKEWFGKAGVAVGCSVTAATLQPAYLAAFATFEAKNPVPGDKVTQDQMFFLYPVHGDLPVDSRTRIWYKAHWVVARWWTSDGVTMGRRMYIRERKRDAGTEKWFDQTQLLVHEFVHTGQYKKVGYRRLAFSRRYLYHLCKAGFNEKKNKMEAEAYGRQDDVDTLLYDRWGRELFHKWSGNNLYDTLGYPVWTKYQNETSPKKPKIDDPLIVELKFQKGRLQVKYWGNDERTCHRTRLTDKKWEDWDCPNWRRD
ncbi:MAG: hypothetical protein M1839_005719 [Geoglossum umbratile]|nr:MAG: hypothetical protein M1839_005719 [Geoglossum umbratile]